MHQICLIIGFSAVRLPVRPPIRPPIRPTARPPVRPRKFVQVLCTLLMLPLNRVLNVKTPYSRHFQVLYVPLLCTLWRHEHVDVMSVCLEIPRESLGMFDLPQAPIENPMVPIASLVGPTVTLNFQIEANGTEMSYGSLHKLLKLSNFRKANHSTKKFKNSASKIKYTGNPRWETR